MFLLLGLLHDVEFDLHLQKKLCENCNNKYSISGFYSHVRNEVCMGEHRQHGSQHDIASMSIDDILQMGPSAASASIHFEQPGRSLHGLLSQSQRLGLVGQDGEVGGWL